MLSTKDWNWLKKLPSELPFREALREWPLEGIMNFFLLWNRKEANVPERSSCETARTGWSERRSRDRFRCLVPGRSGNLCGSRAAVDTALLGAACWRWPTARSTWGNEAAKASAEGWGWRSVRSRSSSSICSDSIVRRRNAEHPPTGCSTSYRAAKRRPPNLYALCHLRRENGEREISRIF